MFWYTFNQSFAYNFCEMNVIELRKNQDLMINIGNIFRKAGLLTMYAN